MRPTLVTAGMDYWRLRPDPRLHGRVSCYYLALPRGQAPVGLTAPFHDDELILPDGLAEIVFCASGRFSRRSLNEPVGELLGTSYVLAGQSQSVLTRDVGLVALAGVKLCPRLLAALTGVPAGALGGQPVGLKLLGAPTLEELEARIFADLTPRGITTTLDAFLLEGLRRTGAGDPLAVSLEATLRARGGSMRLERWAKAQQVSLRTIERRFLASTGMTPKAYAGVVRFRRAYRCLLTGGPLSTAFEGYYDQSHFLKAFRRFTGHTPGRLLLGGRKAGTSISDHLVMPEGADLEMHHS